MPKKAISFNLLRGNRNCLFCYCPLPLTGNFEVILTDLAHTFGMKH